MMMMMMILRNEIRCENQTTYLETWTGETTGTIPHGNQNEFGVCCVAVTAPITKVPVVGSRPEVCRK